MSSGGPADIETQNFNRKTYKTNNHCTECEHFSQPFQQDSFELVRTFARPDFAKNANLLVMAGAGSASSARSDKLTIALKRQTPKHRSDSRPCPPDVAKIQHSGQSTQAVSSRAYGVIRVRQREDLQYDLRPK